jgi:dTMP kinase
MAGRLIVIEGIDGAGTTTQTQRLSEWMNERGLSAHPTREPSTGPVGRLLREALRGGESISGTAMALLFAADRMDHLHREIEPALRRGQHVISDRYTLSSLAYQAEESDRDFVAAINARALRPDLTLYLRVDAKKAAARRAAAGRETERYDALELQERIAKNYDVLAERLASEQRIVTVDGEESVEKVQLDLRKEVERVCA